jgi:hypothetical protein
VDIVIILDESGVRNLRHVFIVMHVLILLEDDWMFIMAVVRMVGVVRHGSVHLVVVFLDQYVG